MTDHNKTFSALYRYLPFAVFMGFIGLDEFLRFLTGQDFIKLEAAALYYLYPIKALTTACILYLFRGQYRELRLRDLSEVSSTLTSCVTGVLVFVLWINMDWTITASAAPLGFNPLLLSEGAVRNMMTSARIAGAVLVVPLMEELFWRSFLLRYIIDKNFDNVTIGTYTLSSFMITVVLFGLEHNFIAAGVMAGACYTILLYKTRSIAQCVLSHAITNLLLAVYVITTGNWQFW